MKRTLAVLWMSIAMLSPSTAAVAQDAYQEKEEPAPKGGQSVRVMGDQPESCDLEALAKCDEGHEKMEKGCKWSLLVDCREHAILEYGQCKTDAQCW